MPSERNKRIRQFDHVIARDRANSLADLFGRHGLAEVNLIARDMAHP